MSERGYTVFVPVCDEEELLLANTERIVAAGRGLGLPFEVLLGLNGSRDASAGLAAQVAARLPEVRVFELGPKGPGAAFRRGIEVCRFERVVCLDMDLSTHLRFLAEAVALLDEHDVVIGSKKSGSENRSAFRRLGSSLYVRCSKLLLGMPFEDYSLGAKGYRKAVLERYLYAVDDGTFYVHKIVFLASRDGLKVAQIPIECEDLRESRFSLWREGLYRFGRLFALWARDLAGLPL